MAWTGEQEEMMSSVQNNPTFYMIRKEWEEILSLSPLSVKYIYLTVYFIRLSFFFGSF